MNSVSRRQFLILGTAALALAGCVPEPPPPVIYTVKDLLAATPFYIAHRGSGDNWPEHTQAAYGRAAAAGAQAIEVSVQATKDGVLICHHDFSTLRMTGVDLEIAQTNYEQLALLNVDATEWLGPNSVVLPIPKLKDVLDEHAAERVIFLEDKQGTNTDALLQLMKNYPNPTEHFIWKQPAPSRRFSPLKEKGYTVWGYFAPEDFEKISELAVDFDYLGVPAAAPEHIVKALVATGKPVICWEVHTRSLRDTMAAWGVAGMMCSNYPYVTTAAPRGNHDQFATGVRTAGDLPAPLALDRQPLIMPGVASILMGQKQKASYSMGSLCPIKHIDYSIGFDLAWPEKVPADFEHAGIAFGQISDAPYVVREPSTVGGYHMVLRGSGSLELFSRQAGQVSGKLLQAVMTEPPQVGAWLRFRIQVSARRILVERMDGAGWQLRTGDTKFRGGYFSLCRNYDDGPPAQFRGVTINPG